MKLRKFILFALTLITCFCVALSVGCANTTPPQRFSSDWEEIPENTNSNLKYFGYYHSDGFLSQPSYMDKIALLENSNVFMINSAFSNDTVLTNLAKCKALNYKAILTIHGLFYGGQIKKANSASLVSNYEEILQEKMDLLQSYIADGTILAFYFDEPAWNGVKQADFRKVTKWLRDNEPNVRVMTTMTAQDIGVAKLDGYPEIDPAYNEYCTDVSYDSYKAWNDNTRLDYLDALKSKALQNQKIWGCITGFVNNPEQNGELYRALKGMYTEAVQEPRYAGMIAFSYADGLEGDWGYGLHSFLNTDSEYYDKELKYLYVNIGREVMGLDAKDFTSDIDLQVYTMNEVFVVGEEVILPSVEATDYYGEGVFVNWKITSPSGEIMPNSSFVAQESGLYTVELSAGEGEYKVSKTVYIPVRFPNEISLFETSSYTPDAGGGAESTWCWPRQVVTNFKRSGNGSLLVTPHATDGDWPRIIFNQNLNQLWDLSNASAVSIWVYNDSNTPIVGFALAVSDENTNKENTYYSFVDLPARVWTQVVVEMAMVKIAEPQIDLTKATIFYGNCASDYVNRANFYIDDCWIIPSSGEEEPDGYSMENAKDIGIFRPKDSDLYSVGLNYNENYVTEGTKSLKLTAEQMWPQYYFTQEFIDWLKKENIVSFTFDMYIDNENSSTEVIKTEGLILEPYPICDEWVTVTIYVSTMTSESFIQFNKDNLGSLTVYLDNIQYTYQQSNNN